MNAKRRVVASILAVAVVAGWAAPVRAGQSGKAGQDGGAITSKNYQEVYERYLTSARKLQSPNLWMADLTTDPKARI